MLGPTEEKDSLQLIFFSNDFPPDDLTTLLRRLEDHSKDYNHPILGRFLEDALQILREEVNQLPQGLRGIIPEDLSIHSLASDTKLRRGLLSGALNGVLLCIVQLGSFIGYCERAPTDALSSIWRDREFAGLGIGMLASAAASLSTGLESLSLVSCGAIRIAFRLGVFVARVSQNIEAVDEEGNWESWAYVVRGVTPERAQQELDAIHVSKGICEINRVFLSAQTQNSVTLSGPPSRLQELFRDSSFYRNSGAVPLPVFSGLCHAPHVYTEQDADKILEGIDFSHFPRSRAPVLASSTGTPFVAKTARDLFHQVVLELLTQRIVLDNVVNHVTESSASQQVARLHLLAFRSHEITDALKKVKSSISVDLVDLIAWIFSPAREGHRPRHQHHSKIAVVGMSCRLPGAKDPEEFWEVLKQGRDMHRTVPSDRFDVASHYDSDERNVNASFTPYGCWIEDPGHFDHTFFNMSPRESEQTDPAQRLALITAHEALERAGFVRNRTPSSNMHRVGTWYGIASDDYREVNTSQDINAYFIPGGCRAFGPGRINYFFKFWGPSYSCDTACSSSLAAVQLACTALWAGEVDTALAGGTNVLTNSDGFAGLSRGHFLSKTPNACKTWDIDADGYCRGEGVVSLVMKRLEDAISDNDNILGIISGAATNHSAESVSITHPHAGAQSIVYRRVLQQAGISPFQVSHAELHGTGTQAGDIQEMTSITDVFAPLHKGRVRSRQLPLYVGAVKSNIGHGEAVAGVSGLLKVLLMLQKGMIPPHVGIKTTINPKLPKDLDERNLHIASIATPWSRAPDTKRMSMVSSFSAAGGNTAVLLEEHVKQTPTQADPRTAHVVIVSAKSKTSLRGNIERLSAWLDQDKAVSLANLGYTTTARRVCHNHRIVFHTKNIEQLQEQLQSSLDRVDSCQPIPKGFTPSVAFTFTGQAAAYPSSNLQLMHYSPIFRSEIHALDLLTRQLGFPSFLPAVDGSHNKDHDHGPVITQLALVCTEIALSRYWEALGVKPDLVVGHSLGEYAALVVAGVLSPSDAIFLVGTRARLLEQHCQEGTSLMLAVRASVDEVEEALSDLPREVACINSPKGTVLAGTVDEINAAQARLQQQGYNSTPLKAAYAFHSAQMDSIVEEFERVARETTIFRAPRIPVLSPLLGKAICDDKTIDATYLRRSTRETCNYASAISEAISMSMVDKDTFWIEIGPHPVTVEFVKAATIDTPVAVPSFKRGEDNWTTLSHSLATLQSSGLDVNWNEFHKPFESALSLVDLPTYSWTVKNYWIPYVGDWLLTKGNDYYGSSKQVMSNAPVSAFHSSLVQTIIHEEFTECGGTITMESDLMQPDFLSAARAHCMNGAGVVTSSIHADISFTLGKYLADKLGMAIDSSNFHIVDMEITRALIAQTEPTQPQCIRVTASTADINRETMLTWYNVNEDGTNSDPFATARMIVVKPETSLKSWSPIVHLIESRIEALDDLARQGIASRFSRNMAYTLFAANLVDYAERYRGMQAVVMNEFEAYADIKLTSNTSGVWTIPPYFIDSVAHLAGFVMNCSDASDTAQTFCVTPGWQTMCFAQQLQAGKTYRSYVKMIPTEEDATVYLGDVYVIDNGRIVGIVHGMKFRRYPRVLLDRFFKASQPSASRARPQKKQQHHALPSQLNAMKALNTTSRQAPAQQIAASTASSRTDDKHHSAASSVGSPSDYSTGPSSASSSPVGEDSGSIIAQATAIIAYQIGVEVSTLNDNDLLEDLGMDSLMSLVIADKLRAQLGITVNGSLFLDYPTIGAVKQWISGCCS